MKHLLLTLTLFPALTFAAFSDVSPNHSYAEAIGHLQSEGIIGGYPDGTFKPGHSINRAEFTKIMVESRYNANQINSCSSNGRFSDVASNAWFKNYVCLAKQQGLIDGYPDGTFGPSNQILLSEAAKIVANAFELTVDMELQPWYAPYLQRLTDLNAIPPSLGQPDQALNRGEMAEMIYRLSTGNVNESASQIIFQTADEEIKDSDFDPDQTDELLALTNAARADNGAAPLSFDPTLNQVAQTYAQRMDQEDFFDHVDPQGNNPGQRLTNAGYRWRFVGENIAKGQVTAAHAFETWQNSPGHWANIINPDYQEIGIGQFKVTDDNFYKGYFWVQVFGTKK